jgi:hypothetical protein
VREDLEERRQVASLVAQRPRHGEQLIEASSVRDSVLSLTDAHCTGGCLRGWLANDA